MKRKKTSPRKPPARKRGPRPPAGRETHRSRRRIRSARRSTPGGKSRAKGSRPTADAARVARIDAAIKRYERASQLAQVRAEELSQLAHTIGEAAVETFRVAVLAEWAEKGFLEDMLELRDALADRKGDGLPRRLVSLRLLPDAVLAWMEEWFGILPFESVGRILEVPVDRLANFSHDFEIPNTTDGLVRIRVVSPGWRRHRVLMIPPRVELA